MERYLNSDRERMINERVHSAVGRKALLMKFIDGLTLLEIAEKLDMPYSTLTAKYYKKWLPELFPVDDMKSV